MNTLPIQRIILYKHGVGYFERRGTVTGETLRLTFPRPAMDDVLKSLVALDLGAGQVRSLDFETPEDREELLAKGSINLSDSASLIDLLRDLRGRMVRCVLHWGHFSSLDDDEPVPDTVEGLVVGVDYHHEKPLPGARLSLYQQETRSVRTIKVTDIAQLLLLDDTAASDLSYFLRAAQSEEDRRSATLHLSPGEHDLLVGYIAPAPAWRVSYRLLYETDDLSDTGKNGDNGAGHVLLQGWGLFDNQLEEDLNDVRLVLVAGMPVSFRYRLYEPDTPERPLVEDEERTVGAPVFFEGAMPPAPPAEAAPAPAMMRQAKAARSRGDMTLGIEEEEAMMADSFSIDDVAGSVQTQASGSERGALFAYTVDHPVSVARGQSAMVPILSQRLACRRELLYNRRKLPDNPVVSLRLQNQTGLTLERGPVTVLEDGDYAGEAVVPFTRTNNEVIVPYAVELGIHVEEQHQRERRIVSISVRNEYLFFQEHELRHTTYQLASTLSEPVDVVIEHVPTSGYELTDTAKPDEQGAGFVRWSVHCAPNAQTTFTVHERTMQHRHEWVKSISGDQLQEYLANKFLDKATVKSLEGVRDLYRQIEVANQRLKKIEREREAIYKQQKQIQGNLAPLSQQGEEGALRKRYVAQLNGLEDQLKTLAAEEQQQHRQVESLKAQVHKKLKEISS